MMYDLRALLCPVLSLFLLAMAGPSQGALTLLSQFNPGEGGQINAVGYDPVADEVFVHFSSNAAIHRYQPDGTFLGSITVGSPSDQGNDSDLEFASEAIDIGGTIVPANSLLIIENDTNPPQIIAADKSTGAVLASQDFNGTLVGGWVGGAWHHDLDAFFNVSWSPDLIDRVDASDGSIDDTFVPMPAGSPPFEIFFGDLDISPVDGNLYVVSDTSTSIRALSPTGTFLADLPLPLGVINLSGIAFNDTTNEAWVSTTDGDVYLLSGFEAVPEPGSILLAIAGTVASGLPRRRYS